MWFIPTVEIVSKISNSVADALVLYATWRSTGNIVQLARQRLGVDVSITSLILTDGMSAGHAGHPLSNSTL